MIKSKVNLNLVTDNGHNVLHLACCHINEYSYDFIKALIDSELDVNMQSTYGSTSLILVCNQINKYSCDCIKLLLDSDSDVNIQNSTNMSALFSVCTNINEYSYDCMKLLLNSGANLTLLINPSKSLISCMLLLCSNKNFNEYMHDCAKLLIKPEINISVALLCACKNGYSVEFIKLLIDSSTNVSNNYTRALDYCCSERIDYDIIMLLLLKIFTQGANHDYITAAKILVSKIDSETFYDRCKNFDTNLLTIMLEINKMLYASNSKCSPLIEKYNQVLLKILVQSLDILLETYPALILDKHFELPNNKYSLPIINILTKYKIEDYENDDCCFICVLSYKYQLVKSPCACKILVHVHCLDRLIATNGHICKTCRTDFDCVEGDEGTHCYPTINMLY